MNVHALSRALGLEEERWELTWEEHEVEIWHRGAGGEHTERLGFLDPDEAASFVRAELAARAREGYAPRRSQRGALRASGALAQAGDVLRSVGHPHGEFLRILAEARPGMQALRARVHAATFADWEPETVGAAWRAGFVVRLRLALSPGPLDPATRLTALLVQPAAWFLETLVLDARARTVERMHPSGEGTAEVRTPEMPLQPVLDALWLARPPPTLRHLGLRWGREAPDLLRLAAAMPALEVLDLAAAGPELAALLSAGRFPALRRLGIRAGVDPSVLAAAEARDIELGDWSSDAPLEGWVAWDDEEEEPPPTPRGANGAASAPRWSPSSSSSSSFSGDDEGIGEDAHEIFPQPVPWWRIEIEDLRGGLSPDAFFDRIRPPEPPALDEEAVVDIGFDPDSVPWEEDGE